MIQYVLYRLGELYLQFLLVESYAICGVCSENNDRSVIFVTKHNFSSLLCLGICGMLSNYVRVR